LSAQLVCPVVRVLLHQVWGHTIRSLLSFVLVDQMYRFTHHTRLMVVLAEVQLSGCTALEMDVVIIELMKKQINHVSRSAHDRKVCSPPERYVLPQGALQ